MGLLSTLRRSIVADLDSRLAPEFHDIFSADPVIIYDAGAAGGVFTPYREGPTAWAPVIGFEPHPESYQLLIESGLPTHATLYNLALSDRDGPVTFHSGAGRQRTKSSLRSIDYIGGEANEITVDALALDSVPDRLSVRPADFIKLDTEGTEDIVLAGGKKMLSENILGAVTEITFWTRQSGGVAFSDIDRLMNANGFVLFDLQLNRSDVRVIGGRKDKVRSGDALYLRNFDWFADTEDREHSDLQSKLLKLISLVVSWRYLNYALELADFGLKRGLLDANQFDAITAPLVATHDLSDRVPNFPGRMAFARLFETLAYACHPSMKKGVPYPFNGLGNHWVVKRRKTVPDAVGLHCPVLQSGTENISKSIRIADRLDVN